MKEKAKKPRIRVTVVNQSKRFFTKPRLFELKKSFLTSFHHIHEKILCHISLTFVENNIIFNYIAYFYFSREKKWF